MKEAAIQSLLAGTSVTELECFLQTFLENGVPFLLYGADPCRNVFDGVIYYASYHRNAGANVLDELT